MEDKPENTLLKRLSNQCRHGNDHALNDEHPCPYQCEINDDHEFFCHCCGIN